jgi:transcriptional regulator with XRE-family HTH domain/DNA-directed RNA polymerase subunit RPC12/RpoP
MDQKITGNFIAELRRERSLTQRELADKLLISDKTVSKWEQGRGFPDVSLMLPLCEILGITVNELLSGKRLQRDEYQQNAEKNMVRLMQDKKEFKLKFLVECLVMVVVLTACLALCVVAGYAELSMGWRIGLIVLALVIVLIGCVAGVILERTSFAYRCVNCEHSFVPTVGAYLMGAHTLTKRHLKCPKCGKRTWCKLCDIADVKKVEDKEE